LYVLHELMNLDIGLARFTFDHFKYVDARVELSPLTRPILSDFLFPDDSTALGGLGPTDILTHERECAVDVSPIKSSVSPRDQLVCRHALYYRSASSPMVLTVIVV